MEELRWIGRVLGASSDCLSTIGRAAVGSVSFAEVLEGMTFTSTQR